VSHRALFSPYTTCHKIKLETNDGLTELPPTTDSLLDPIRDQDERQMKKGLRMLSEITKQHPISPLLDLTFQFVETVLLGQQDEQYSRTLCFSSPLPKYIRRQRTMPADVAKVVATKFADIRNKGYVTPVHSIVSVVDSFPVPKVVDDKGTFLDVQMVYSGTSSGLNDVCWAPPFWLPTADTAIRQLGFHDHCMDLDMGEIFLNFILPDVLRPYTGVNMAAVRSLLEALDGQDPVAKAEAWARLFMGFKGSPFNAIRHFYHTEDFIIGLPSAENSALRWDKIVLNCPGQVDFDPRMLRVYKWDAQWQGISGAVVTFVDDERGSGITPEHT
jgi:hypothetical protein